MNKRERILAMLQGNKPDKLPWCADLAYWIDYLNDEKLMPEKYLQKDAISADEKLSMGLAAPFNTPGLIQLHRDLDVGFYLQGYFPFDTIYDDTVQTKTVFTDVKEGQLRTITVTTPLGSMEEVWEYRFSTHSWGPKQHMVKGVEDIPKLKYLYEHTTYVPNYATAEERVPLVDGIGVVLVYIPKAPIMELIALRAGIETVVDMLAEDEEAFEELLEVMERKHDEACEIALKAPCECIMCPDNLSSGSIGRNLYRKYDMPYAKKWTKRIREAGKYSFVHLDGTLNPLLTDVCEAGYDVIEGLTPGPMGDLEYEQMRPLASENAILWGCIPSNLFDPDYPDEAFDEYVIRLIGQMVADGRSVLAVGDQVVPRTRAERIKRVNELVEKYGAM